MRQIERTIEVPQIEYEDRIVEVPEVREVVRRVPRVEVREIPIERIIQVPKKIIHEIEQPVYRPVPHLVQQPVEREIPIPKQYLQTLEVVKQVAVPTTSVGQQFQPPQFQPPQFQQQQFQLQPEPQPPVAEPKPQPKPEPLPQAEQRAPVIHPPVVTANYTLPAASAGSAYGSAVMSGFQSSMFQSQNFASRIQPPTTTVQQTLFMGNPTPPIPAPVQFQSQNFSSMVQQPAVRAGGTILMGSPTPPIPPSGTVFVSSQNPFQSQALPTPPASSVQMPGTVMLQSQQANASSVFDMLDKDKSGTITRRELEEALSKGLLGPPQQSNRPGFMTPPTPPSGVGPARQNFGDAQVYAMTPSAFMSAPSSAMLPPGAMQSGVINASMVLPSSMQQASASAQFASMGMIPPRAAASPLNSMGLQQSISYNQSEVGFVDAGASSFNMASRPMSVSVPNARTMSSIQSQAGSSFNSFASGVIRSSGPLASYGAPATSSGLSRSVFDQLDSDNSGTISREEFEKAMKSQRQSVVVT